MQFRTFLSLLKQDLRKPHSVLRRSFLLLLTLFLAVTLVLQALLFRTTRKSLQQRVWDAGSAVLTSTVALSDASLTTLSEGVSQLSWDKDVLSLVVFPGRMAGHQVLDIIEALKSFSDRNSYVQSVSLLCESNDTVYTSSGEISPLSATDAARSLNAPAVARIDGSECELVQTQDNQLCLRYRFIAGSYGYLGTLLVYLNAGQFFSGIYSGTDRLLVESETGTVLYDSTDSIPCGRSYTPPDTGEFLTETSPLTSLVFYHDCAPVQFHIGSYLKSFNGVFLLAAILPLICLLSLVAAWIFYRPLYDLLHSLDEGTQSEKQLTDTSPDEWSRLNSAISQMSRKTAQYDGIIQSASPYIQSELLCRLLDGASISPEDIRQTLSNIQSPLPFEGTFVLFVVRNQQSGVMNEAVVQHTIHRLQNLQHPGCRFFSFDYHYAVLTVAAAETAPEDPDRLLEDVLHTMTVYTGSLLNVAVLHSAPFYQLSRIGAAYKNALMQTPQASSEGYGGAALMAQICQSVGAIPDQPEEAGVLVVKHLLFTVERSGLPDDEKSHCYRVFFREIGKLAHLYRVEPSPPPVIEPGDPENVSRAAAYACQILHQVFVNLDNRQHKYLMAAMRYMDQHYMDSGLSLNSVAAEIGISPSYLSRIFTDAYHVRFTKKLNDLRIEKSKELLADQSILIRDISTAVGFLTIQNFMRVFKQTTGVTPSEYRAVQAVIGGGAKAAESGTDRTRSADPAPDGENTDRRSSGTT